MGKRQVTVAAIADAVYNHPQENLKKAEKWYTSGSCTLLGVSEDNHFALGTF